MVLYFICTIVNGVIIIPLSFVNGVKNFFISELLYKMGEKCMSKTSCPYKTTVNLQNARRMALILRSTVWHCGLFGTTPVMKVFIFYLFYLYFIYLIFIYILFIFIYLIFIYISLYFLFILFYFAEEHVQKIQ